MNGINVYQTPSGWVYEVRFMGCLTVIGCCATLAAATLQASLMGEDTIQNEQREILSRTAGRTAQTAHESVPSNARAGDRLSPIRPRTCTVS